MIGLLGPIMDPSGPLHTSHPTSGLLSKLVILQMLVVTCLLQGIVLAWIYSKTICGSSVFWGKDETLRSLFCFFRVHNADYYMQEAKKLKHKADALVGFSPLAASLPFQYHVLKGNKEVILSISPTASLLC